jgi:uncharacterized RDD family membrane protein YckC
MTDQPQQPPQQPPQPPQQPGQPGYGYGTPPPPPAQPGQGAGGYGTPPVPPGGVNPYSPWEKRAVGFLVDWVVQAVPYLVLLVLGSIIGGAFGGLLGIIGGLLSIGVWVWNIGVLQGSTGQSIGKGVAGVRVVREDDGQVLGTGMSLVRSLAHIVDSLACYVGWFWPLWDAKRQTFADKIMKTLVYPAPTKSIQESLPF